MGKCLIFLTKKYPFETGEEFIENEIPVIAKEFEKVIIISTSVSDSSRMTRAVPKNAEVRPLASADVKKGLLRLLPKLLPFSNLKKLSGEKEYNSIKASFSKKMFLLYFAAKSEAVFEKCADILKEFDIGRYGEAVFYSYWFYDTAYAAVKLRDICTVKTKYAVCRAHRYDLYHDQSTVGYIPLRRYILNSIDKVYPCSGNGSSYLGGLYGEYAGKIETAYLGTNDYGISPAVGGGAFHIVSCCHISPVKRVDMLARALYGLKGSGLKLKWTHFGGGDGLEGLKKYADENLAFMEFEFKGEIKNSELMAYYKKNHVDCFINTSSSEGLPVSIMEACSFGIPVIATDVGGTSEIVKNSVNGFLIRCDFSSGELSDKIKALYAMSGEDMLKLRAAGREIWLKDFSCVKNYGAFAKKISRPNGN